MYSLLTLFGVVTLIFFLFNTGMGDPAQMKMGQRTNLAATEQIRRDWGLDKPMIVRYLSYLNDLSPLSLHSRNAESAFFYDQQKYRGLAVSIADITVAAKAPYLRRSYQSEKRVSTAIAEVFPNTLILALAAIVFASLVGIAIGVISALLKNTVWDKLLLTLTTLGMSTPSFFAALLVGWIFAFLLGNYTHLNLTGNLWELDDYGESLHLHLKNLLLPALTLGVRPLSVIAQLARSSLLDVLSQDYIRTARAKGLSFVQVLRRHALRNALNPVVTAISGWFASMLAGVIFVEYIFGYKGLGFLMIDALNMLDMPVVMGCVMLIAIAFVVVNLLADLCYALLDPRIKL
ncbi:peptide ABC transporter permease [Bacteroidia bacterium]|nr:peptide ABC transporter permease [Bacteroidia bacterium]GHT73600.1 peptide ABC transporter permease [Bacteroidia bacterium]